MIESLIGRWPRLVISRKGGELGSTSRIVSLAGWSHLGHLKIDEYVYIGPSARLFALGGISIGSGTIIGPRLTVYTSNHDFFSSETIPYSNTSARNKPVNVGKGCWFGDSVMLLPGATLGDHCLVGAGSVVRGSFPAGTIISGNPALAISTLSEEQIDIKYRLLAERKFYLKLT